MPTKHAIHHGKRIHVRCRRCGRRAYHLRQRTCAACGYGASPKLRRNSWATKKLNRSTRLA
ncbi:50S ribosomal protein L37e [Candidatus Bathyarchaeota archaeon]|nr:50S ribosomal protein L37e [Candidatus Bathyarchaeota archaeon]MBL7168425.1 50S ribosomal protein L37e [Candidatus Bathyarchaeota archaeon]